MRHQDVFVVLDSCLFGGCCGWRFTRHADRCSGNPCTLVDAALRRPPQPIPDGSQDHSQRNPDTRSVQADRTAMSRPPERCTCLPRRSAAMQGGFGRASPSAFGLTLHNLRRGNG